MTEKVYDGKFFEEYIKDQNQVYNMAMDALEFYNLHIPVEGMGYLFFTDLDDEFAYYKGERSYSGCDSDYYCEQLPIEFLWNKDFQLKYIAEVKENARLAEEKKIQEAKEKQQRLESTEEGRERLEYERLKKKYGGF